MTSLGSYSKLREQLIAANVEIEEKAKVCALLRDKIHTETKKLMRIDKELSAHYSSIMEKYVNDFKDTMTHLVDASNQMMNEKADHLKSCKALVSDLERVEDEIRLEGRKIHNDIDHKIEREKKIFRAGREDRWQQYLADQIRNYKSLTEKSLQPEKFRIRKMHEKEMNEIDVRSRLQERTLRDEFAAKLQHIIDDEFKVSRDRSVLILRDLDLKQSEALTSLEKEHQVRLDDLNEELETKYRNHLTALNKRVEGDREKGRESITLAEERSKKSIKNTNEAYVKELQDMRRLLADQISDRVKQLDLKKNSDALFNDEDDEFFDAPVADDDVARARDKRLQDYIKTQQAENIQLEREWKNNYSREITRIEELTNLEEEEIKRRSRSTIDNVASLAMDKEVAISDIQWLSEAIAQKKEGIDACVTLYESNRKELADKTAEVQRIKGKKQKQRADLHRERQEYLEQALLRVEELRRACDTALSETEESLRNMKDKHTEELEKLNAQVKESIVTIDSQSEKIRDEVRAEIVKLNKLNKLAEGYSRST